MDYLTPVPRQSRGVAGKRTGVAARYECDVCTALKPVSRFQFMWPWVAQVALPEEINRLEPGEALVRVELVPTVWGISVKEYLADLLAYVDSHYAAAGNYFYLSPQLAAHCPPPAP